MNSVKIRRALGVSVVTVLVATASPYASASAVPPVPPVPGVRSLVATSDDGAVFDLEQYAEGDITVQLVDSIAGSVDADDAQDLSYSWAVEPFNGGPVVNVPATDTNPVADDVAGKFTVPLPTTEGPGTYTLTAGLTADAAAANAIAGTELLTVTAGNAAPAGSTAEIKGLDAGTPGLAQDATLTLTAPDSSPVEGQVYTLKLDHGFFTDGTSATAPVAGAPAGDLKDLGDKLTAFTDANGQIDFTVGIARDEAFDDDGKATSTVTSGVGPEASDSAAWSTSKSLNGRVAITLSPQGEQDGPVNPTAAGNRTYYDVFAQDQFGNRVGGETIELGLSGNLDDYNDSGDDSWVSDFTARGDIWVLSNEAGDIDITGTWEQAPTYTYDANGNAVAATADATGTTTSTTYEIDFDASTFTITSSATDTVLVGSKVSDTVKVVDQEGNPVAGYEVRFLRYGPDKVRGDVVANRVTNSNGTATYPFIGTKLGRGTVTAVVSDGNGGEQSLTITTVFGSAVTARLYAGKGGSGRDRLTVKAGSVAKGAKVEVFRLDAGLPVLVATGKLSSKGNDVFSVRDRNGKAKSQYLVEVRSTPKTVAAQSNTVTIR